MKVILILTVTILVAATNCSSSLLGSRILNGEDSAALYHVDITFSNAYAVGGTGAGAIISQYWIVTSASNIKGYSKWTITKVNYNGKYDYWKTTESTYAIPHPKYHAGLNKTPRNNDIGLIQTTIISKRNTFIALPALGQAMPLENEEISILGTGRINNYVATSKTLQVGYQRVSSNNYCQKHYNWYSTAGYFCGTGLSNACIGDVGGSATVVSQGKVVLVGIISVGSGFLIGCESHGLNGFTKVSDYRQWIKTNSKI